MTTALELDLDAVQDRFFQGRQTSEELAERPDDLCGLSQLSEQTLLQNLERRFAEGIIYTYVGTILVSVNPFKYLPIYNPKFGELYRGARLEDPTLRPHVFAIADDSFSSMVRDKQRQCIVISGESGSGKTETTKLLLHHIMQVSAKIPTSEELRRILGTAPVLEAFGNAKTVSNNNSSRFGKFMMLNFRSNGSYAGASIEKYLLEKSRLIQQNQIERNYHIFYLLLAGADKKLRTRFFLTNDVGKYQILSGTEDPESKCYTVPGVDDAKEFESLIENMHVFFTPNQIQQVFQLIATLLNLGNIGFADLEAEEGSVVDTNDSLRVVSNLLRVHRETLGVALVTKKTVIRGQEFSCRFKKDEAEDNKWAMVKCLYEAMFDWIVTKLNIKLLGKRSERQSGTSSIGILDIFGFEDFPRNSFEQFCINFANESLQQYFIKHIFQLEQMEYEREGINWSSIKYVDNQECLELLTKKPTGLFHILDEESRLSQGNDTSLFEKCTQTHKSHACFEVPHTRGIFILKHYAGAVTYTIDGFRDKNRDLMRQDIIHVLQNSRTPFIRELIFKESSALRRWRKAYDVITGLRYWQMIASPDNSGELEENISSTDKLKRSWSSAKQHVTPHRPEKQSADKDGAKKSKQSATVGGQFMSSLGYLMDTLSQAEPYFVRCIKSNPNQDPLCFHQDKISTQLRYCGMLETVRIRQLGYNIRMPVSEFLEAFGILLPSHATGNSSRLAATLLQHNGIPEDQAQVGCSKVFMRNKIELKLETAVHHKMTRVAIVIQRAYRKWMTAQNEAAKSGRTDSGPADADEPEDTSTMTPPQPPSPPPELPPDSPPDSPVEEKPVPTETPTPPPKRVPMPATRQRSDASKPVPVEPTRPTPRARSGAALLHDAMSATEEKAPEEEPAAKPEAVPAKEEKEEEPAAKPAVTEKVEEKAEEKAPAKVEEKAPEKVAEKAITPQEPKPIPPDFYHVLQAAVKKSAICGYCGKQLASLKKSVVCGVCETNYHQDCLKLDGICPKSPHSPLRRVIISTLGDCDRFGTCLVSKLARLKTMKKMSRDDRLFRNTLKEYHSGFILQFSIGVKSGGSMSSWTKFNLTRGLLEDNFQIMMLALLPHHPKANTVLVKKMFFLVLDEFEDSRDSVAASTDRVDLNSGGKSKKEEAKHSRQGKEEKLIEHNSHRFHMENFTVPTMCEHCKKTLMALEEGAVCQVCKTTVHHNCIKKVKIECKHKGNNVKDWTGDVFGATLTQMYNNTKLHVPTILENVMTEIEGRCLFTPGIYRKGASPGALKRLRAQVMAFNKSMILDLSSYDGHTLGALLKAFLRELNEAVIPEYLYKSFIQSATASSEQQRLILELIPSMPAANQFFLERLSFHLALVAQNEAANNMNVKNLAIIFAPIVVVPPRSMGAMEALQQVSMQSIVMETFIEATLSKLASAVSEITEIETEKAVIQQAIDEHTKNAAEAPEEPKNPPPDVSGEESKPDESSPSSEETKEKALPVPPSKKRMIPPGAGRGPPQINLAAMGGGSDVLKKLQEKMAALDNQKNSLTSNVQALDVKDEPEPEKPTSVSGLKTGFALPQVPTPPKKKNDKVVKPNKKTNKVSGSLDIPGDSNAPAPVLQHVTKGRPRPAGGRRPPTRAHRQDLAAQAENVAE